MYIVYNMNVDKMSRPDWVDSNIYPFESKWMTLEGHGIHYVDEGPKNAPVLLFVHPAAGWSFTYRYHIRKLSKDFRCVAPDLPGYGLSLASDKYKYSLLEQSHVLEQFVKILDLRDIVVWANDGGGPTAVLALANQSDRVLGLVVGGTFGWSLKDYPEVSRMLRFASGPVFRIMNRYTNIFSRIMGTKALGTRKLSKTEQLHYSLPFKKRNTRNYPLILIGSFLDPEVQRKLDLSIPSFRDKAVLIQFGTKDRMTRQKWPERWVKEVPNNRVHMLTGVDHFPFEDVPETTVQNFQVWWTDLKTRNHAIP